MCAMYWSLQFGGFGRYPRGSPGIIGACLVLVAPGSGDLGPGCTLEVVSCALGAKMVVVYSNMMGIRIKLRIADRGGLFIHGM